MRTFASLRNADLGFNPDYLLTTKIDLSPSTYRGRNLIADFYQPLLEKVRAIPGVKHAGLIQGLPIHNWGINSEVKIVGHPPTSANQETLAESRLVTPDYFSALGISLVRGRMLDEKIDTPASLPVTVVNEAFVEKFFAEGEDRLASTLTTMTNDNRRVVRSVRQDIYQPPMAEMDYSISQVPTNQMLDTIPYMWLVVRTSVEPESIVPSLAERLP